MKKRDKFKQKIWESERYYQMAQEGSMDKNHPGMVILQKLSLRAKNILDLGCGEGTRLNTLLTDKQKGTGVDISQKALEMGRKKYTKISFIKADLEKIFLSSNSYDLVFSAYVLEHLTDPKIVIKEAMRLTSKGGNLLLISPNYGAPNRASPPFKASRLNKFIIGVLDDFINLIIKREVSWKKVEPISNIDKYEMDLDTTVEPYLGSLINNLKLLDMEILEYTSCWSQELPNAKIYQRAFRFFGEMGIYPFNLWGPHLVVVARKKI